MANLFRDSRMLNAKGQPAWCINYRDLSGKRCRERLNAVTQEQAELLFAKRVGQLAHAEGMGVTSEESIKPITFRKFTEETYLPFIQQHSKPTTYKRYASTAKVIYPFIGDKIVQHLRPKDIRECLMKRAGTTTRKKKLLGKATLNRDRQIVYAVLKMAMADELITSNPTVAVAKHKEPPGRSRWLRKSEVASLLNTIEAADSSLWLIPLVKMAVLTGMRVSEILNLKRGDIQETTIRLALTKNGKERHVRINQPIREILEEAGVYNKSIGPDGAGIYVFPNKNGKPFLKSSVSHALKRAVQVCGFDTDGPDAVTFHTLRHTAVSWMVQAGVPDRQIMEAVGHGSADMISRYAHLAPDNVSGPAKALESSFMEVEQIKAQESSGVPRAKEQVPEVIETKANVKLSNKAG